jgi:hypothetical protein
MATTTETDETKVTLIHDGKETDMGTMTEFEETTREALDRTRDRQLSFNVGGREPNRSSLKTSVDILIPRELRKGSEIRLAITGPDGELLAQTKGKVVGVTFEDEYKDGFLVGSERIHKVKLGI